MPSGHLVTSNNRKIRATIKKTLAAHHDSTVTVLSSLLAIEDAIGYIPPQAIEEVAKFTRSTINDVWGAASFYTNFRTTPPGKHVIEVCWGPSCHMRGAKDILKRALTLLDLKTEGDTNDNLFTVKYNTCLGACAHAPVISIDHHLIGDMTPEQVRQQIEDLRSNTDKQGGDGNGATAK